LIRDIDKNLLRDNDRMRLEIRLLCNLVLYTESNTIRKAAQHQTWVSSNQEPLSGGGAVIKEEQVMQKLLRVIPKHLSQVTVVIEVT
jgi:hypothetical protein